MTDFVFPHTKAIGILLLSLYRTNGSITHTRSNRDFSLRNPTPLMYKNNSPTRPSTLRHVPPPSRLQQRSSHKLAQQSKKTYTASVTIPSPRNPYRPPATHFQTLQSRTPPVQTRNHNGRRPNDRLCSRYPYLCPVHRHRPMGPVVLV